MPMDQVRQALQSLPAPVALIGAKDGERHNITTVAWISQESGDPPQVMVSIAPQRFIHDMIVKSKEFMVTVMGDGDKRLPFSAGQNPAGMWTRLRNWDFPPNRRK